ncbi:hypothetical protein [Ideonella alba]|uniref:Response regulatory domain-containing protein n=1 Tax=Ideonella alba TaxID=2824118 RepID=A0A940YB26_9BURK|nr:hypothetical protein [Ideonella alba]MBQ0930923.1 hypothetical protein [Ideonella alba]
MNRIIVIHPSGERRERLAQALQPLGGRIVEAFSRGDSLQRLAGPDGQRRGDLVVIDLSDWAVPGTALIRALRRQVTSPLPVLVCLPPQSQMPELAAQAARTAGANLLLPSQASLAELTESAAMLLGLPMRPLAGAAHGQQRLIDAWQQQLELVALPDTAAPTVVSARRVFESLLSLREDERGGEAALALTGLAGGPVPLGRWGGWYHPAHETVAGEAELSRRRQRVQPLCLLFDAGGQRFALPLDAEVAPGCWWSDGHPLPPMQEPVAALPLVRLFGSSGFRRLLCTDRATIVLRRQEAAQVHEQGLRVDEVLGIEPLALDPCPPATALASGCQALAIDRDGEPVLVLDGRQLWLQLAALSTPVSPR